MNIIHRNKIKILTESDVSTLGLSNQFNLLSGQFYSDMAFVKTAQEYKLPEFLKNLPNLDLDKWSNTKHSNCNNFARDEYEGDFFQPGRTYDEKVKSLRAKNGSFAEYVGNAVYRVILDGYRPLRHSFLEARTNEYPTALFFHPRNGPQSIFNNHDFHWFAPRLHPYPDSVGQKVVWAHKRGSLDAQICSSTSYAGMDLGAVDIFADAAKNGYTYFSGFFAMPTQTQRHAPSF